MLFVVTNKPVRIKRVSVEWGSTVVLNFLIHCIVIVFLLYLFCLLLVCNNMYLLTEWEGRTGKYLARGQGVRTERSEVRTP